MEKGHLDPPRETAAYRALRPQTPLSSPSPSNALIERCALNRNPNKFEFLRNIDPKGSAALMALLIVVFVLGILAASDYLPFFDGDEKEHTSDIQWMDDYDEGMRNASESGRPAMVYFHTEWCTYCKEMDNDTFSTERIATRSRQFTPIIVDGDERQDLVDRYGVDGYPTVVFVDEDENELHRAVGYRNAEDFRADMNTALDNY